ncbi:hypothetical protein ACHAW6_011136 [Cyclotella cf. meneghiniana]
MNSAQTSSFMSNSSTRRMRQVHQSLFFFVVLLTTWTLVSFSVTFLECPSVLHPFLPINDLSANDNKAAISRTRRVFIPGAGFSGFFYTMGRLHSLAKNNTNNTSPRNEDHDVYYCFSAGCLALVATLMEVPLHSAIEMALGSRGRWSRGEIGRYDIVGDFVDRLLISNDETPTFERNCSLLRSQMFMLPTLHDVECGQYYHNFTPDLTNYVSMPHSTVIPKIISTNQPPSHKIQHHLSKINIITTTWSNKKNTNLMISQSIRSPSSLLNLKEMLLQTTYIPFVTGPTLGKFDASSETYHNDGAFVSLLHGWHTLLRTITRNQKSEVSNMYSLKLPWDAELIFHGLNLGLDRDKAVHFWRRGLSRGV